ncbi:MAG: beta strand repeat-containing protein, partial [Leptothrix sp. (in: b-proteobacteria)]
TADHGTVTYNAATSSYTVTPTLNYNGPVTLNYGVTDGLLTVASTLSSTLAPVNDAPALTGAAATLAGVQDTPYTINASDLLAGWIDVDSPTLSVANLSADHGGIVDNLDGTYTLTPATGYSGAVTLSYQVSDGIANVTASLGVNLAFNATVTSPQSFTLAAPTGTNDQTNVVLAGTGNINATGNTLNNHLTGNDGDNTLDGGAGNDTLDGGNGNDLLLGGAGNDALLGGATGNDTLNGGTGADWMAGGVGDDTYYVDNMGDVVFEKAGQGTDTVISTISYVLGANVENLTLDAAGGAIHGYGNDLNNVIIGNDSGNYLSGGAGNDTLTGGAGNDILIGGSGADSMAGGAGNDTYNVDNVGDVITEAANGGTDTVVASISYTLGANVENLTLDAAGGAISGTGNDLNNVIAGNNSGNVLSGGAGNDALLGGAGNDTLDGGTGNDWMAGGAGNDTYHVDSQGDVVIEQANGGTDTVVSTISYVLGSNVENLTLDSAGGAIHGYGNALDNVITGNASDNYISGGAGADTMAGGAGNDTYIVDNVGDVVTESANAGTDTVISSVSYTLGANVENLTLDAAGGAINATGNDLNNVIIGNNSGNVLSGGAGNDALLGGAGNDTLDGGTGNDWMAGGAGNDTYHVDSAGDVVTEQANGGTDTVISTISYVLGANVENLTLDAAGGNINGFGNALDNVIVGNAGNNVLFGGAGNDSLTGGAGNDLFVFNSAPNAATNVDTITDFTAGADHLEFDHTVFTSLSAYGASVQNGAGMTSVSSAHTFLAFDTSTGNLYYDADGANGQAGVLVAHLTGVTHLSSSDVWVV